MRDDYHRRLDVLGETWLAWADIGAGLGEERWAAPTRCPGWDVAAVYAHHSAIPAMLDGEGTWPDVPVGSAVTAADLLRLLNAPGGLANEAAGAVADGAVAEAAGHSTAELVDRFRVRGPRAVRRLREADPARVVPWPPGVAATTLAEAVRIVLMEAVVHLLDVLRAVDRDPDVPPAALAETAQLLAEVPPAVEFIEAATGRSGRSPLPVLR